MMKAQDKKNSDTSNSNLKAQNKNTNDKSTRVNEEMHAMNEMKKMENNKAIANQGYTVRNGYDPNKPNPDRGNITNRKDDIEDGFQAESDVDQVGQDREDLYLEDEILNRGNSKFVNSKPNQDDDFNKPDGLEDENQNKTPIINPKKF